MTEQVGFGSWGRGFRLERVEIHNWGTFDGKTAVITPGCMNMLLTGANGSGKSTIVDAISTLFCSPSRISFNKAAGASQGERNLASYIRGKYRSSEKESDSQYLRDSNTFSIILAVFRDCAMGRTVSTALFCYCDERDSKWMYFGSEDDMAIKTHFSNFVSPKALRAEMRKNGISIFDEFSAYREWFCNKVGIRDKKNAMSLFLQTVSMKTVEGLDSFVKNFMIEKYDADKDIDKFTKHFDNLVEIHKHIRGAKRKVELLEPLIKEYSLYEKSKADEDAARKILTSFPRWRDEHRVQLLNERLSTLKKERSQLNDRLSEKQRQKESLKNELERLSSNIHDNGGGRLNSLEHDISEEEKRVADRTKKAGKYISRVNDTKFFDREMDIGHFHYEEYKETQAKVLLNAQCVKEDIVHKKSEIDELQEPLQELNKKLREVTDELSGLESRKNNIPQIQVDMRTRLCDSLDIPEDELPFAGELMCIRDDAREWEGAVERIMNGFARSMIVPERHYPSIVRWVNENHLNGQLVYLKVANEQSKNFFRLDPNGNKICDKVSVKPGTPFSEWIEDNIATHFNHACCEDASALALCSRGITKAGQEKSSSQRHIKNDRYKIDDSSRYVLGWNNTDKIERLNAERTLLLNKYNALKQKQKQIENECSKLNAIQESIKTLAEDYADYEEMNFGASVKKLEELRSEKAKIEDSSNVLATLKKSEAEKKETLKDTEMDYDQLVRSIGETEGKQEEILKNKNSIETNFSEVNLVEGEIRCVLDKALSDTLDGVFLTLDNFEQVMNARDFENKNDNETWGTESKIKRKSVEAKAKKKVSTHENACKAKASDISKIMSDFHKEFRNDVLEAGDDVSYIEEYRAVYDKTVKDDLPAYEERFQKALGEEVMSGISLLCGNLAKEERKIREKIDEINGALVDIDYNPGRYIRLEAKSSSNPKINKFKSDLKESTVNTMSETVDMEQKFLAIQETLLKLKGRPGHDDEDKKWRDEVTDVRNWLTFSAREIDRETNTEYEYYSDSGGKSGGQKEKLAYTVLAAGIAYQFGLNYGSDETIQTTFDIPKSFNFIMIDEAFNKGSAESAEYALNLFTKLDIQFLVVTPMQKINVIDKYVSSVGFVHAEKVDEGLKSLVMMVPMGKYREMQEQMSA